jgi:hypothetical protein
MNIENWNPFFKIDSIDLVRCMSQQTYEPLISPDGKVFCANYAWPNNYQLLEDPTRSLYTKEVTDWFFENEVSYILKYKDKSYMPVLLDIDHIDKKIYFEWNGETCNDILYTGKQMPDGWKLQIKDIMLDLFNTGTYKLTMYPHCHYFDKTGQMKAIDWYGCVPVNNPYIESKYMDGIIHESAIFRLKETGELIDNRYDLEKMFKRSMKEHVTWGNQTMKYIYNEIF